MTGGGIQQILKWYVKRKIREICTPRIANQLLGEQGAIHQLWSIGIVSGSSPLRLRHARGATNPVLTREDVSDVRALFVADPFLLRVGKVWHMFFEVYNFDSDRGEIAWATSPDGFVWEYQKIVLRESFHLSYPYVFEWQGEYYMIPETHQAESVRLYQPEEVTVGLRWAGLEVTGIFGNFQGDPYERDSERLILLGRKPA